MTNQSGKADWGCISLAVAFIALVVCIAYVNIKDSERQHEREMKRMEIETALKVDYNARKKAANND